MPAVVSLCASSFETANKQIKRLPACGQNAFPLWQNAQDCAQLSERLVCTVGWHGVGKTLRLAGDLELIGEPQRHFVKEAGQRRAICFGVLQFKGATLK